MVQVLANLGQEIAQTSGEEVAATIALDAADYTYEVDLPTFDEVPGAPTESSVLPLSLFSLSRQSLERGLRVCDVVIATTYSSMLCFGRYASLHIHNPSPVLLCVG